jgi:hypothetical protein
MGKAIRYTISYCNGKTNNREFQIILLFRLILNKVWVMGDIAWWESSLCDTCGIEPVLIVDKSNVLLINDNS